MAKRSALDRPDIATPTEPVVLSVDGKLWTPATDSPFDPGSFIAARALIKTTRREARWNPWVEADRADELREAALVVDQWQRAEPDFRAHTADEIDTELDELRLASRRSWEDQQTRWRRDRSRYDAGLEQARLSMLENLARLEVYRAFAQLASGSDSTCSGVRDPELQDALDRVRTTQQALEALAARCGDIEDIVDRHGRNPSDRREDSLFRFANDRRTRVTHLRSLLDNHNRNPRKARLERQADGTESTPSAWRTELASLLEIPPTVAQEMCSECPVPAAWHTPHSPAVHQRPCPAWPETSARLQMSLSELTESLRRHDQLQPHQRDKPLASVPARQPVGVLLARLGELQELHPTAIVKAGRGGKLEIWAP